MTFYKHGPHSGSVPEAIIEQTLIESVISGLTRADALPVTAVAIEEFREVLTHDAAPNILNGLLRKWTPDHLEQLFNLLNTRAATLGCAPIEMPDYLKNRVQPQTAIAAVERAPLLNDTKNMLR